NEWKYVTRTHKIRRPAVAVRERAHRVASLVRRDAGGQSVADIDRDGESRTQRRLVVGNHRLKMKAARLLGPQGCTDDAGCIANDERHLFRRAVAPRPKQNAFSFPLL